MRSPLGLVALGVSLNPSSCPSYSDVTGMRCDAKKSTKRSWNSLVLAFAAHKPPFRWSSKPQIVGRLGVDGSANLHTFTAMWTVVVAPDASVSVTGMACRPGGVLALVWNRSKMGCDVFAATSKLSMKSSATYGQWSTSVVMGEPTWEQPRHCAPWWTQVPSPQSIDSDGVGHFGEVVLKGQHLLSHEPNEPRCTKPIGNASALID